MGTAGIVLVFVGILLYLGGLAGIVIEAFGRSIWWGLGVLILPPVALVFVALNWARARGACLAIVAGLLVSVAGVVLYAER